MTNTNVSPRFDGSVELTAADVERLPYVSLLPGDFTDRLERLKEASGLSWSGFAKAIGIDYETLSQIVPFQKMTEIHRSHTWPGLGTLHTRQYRPPEPQRPPLGFCRP